MKGKRKSSLMAYDYSLYIQEIHMHCNIGEAEYLSAVAYASIVIAVVIFIQ